MITQEMKIQYANISAQKGTSEADNHFNDIISALETGAERAQAWNELREVLYANNAAAEKAQAAAKRLAAKNKRTIGKVAKELLAAGLSGRDYDFVVSIQRKRTLTEKQGKWFDDICRNKNVGLAEYGKRKSPQAVANCQHEDLGSFGYTHGTTVNCPFCGKVAEVW